MEANSFISSVKSFENGPRTEIPYLYLDTTGHVTIGTGLMYRNVHKLIQDRLHFVVNGSGKPATNEQIKKAFEAVKHSPSKLLPERYRDIKDNNITANTSRLNSIFNARLARARDIAIQWFGHDVKNEDSYTTFDSLPEDIQYALVDMAYNMGSNEHELTGLAKFKNFRRALHEGDFATAAQESFRPDVKRGSLRNQRVYDWIYKYSLDEAFNRRIIP